MRLMDIFRRKRKSPLLLEEGKTKEAQKPKEDTVDVQIFSKRMEGSKIEYSIVLKSEENSILVGRTYSSSEENTAKNVELKRIARKVKEAVYLVSTENEKSQYFIEKAKKEAKEKMQEMADKEGVTLTKNVMQYIDKYESYKSSDSKREKMTDEDEKRLQELESIKTPDDAYACKQSLIAYMKKIEKVPVNPIIEANIKSLQEGKKLDDETVKRIATYMEESGNEDGLLYSVYLKIEEERIWRQLKTRLAQYSNESENKEITDEVYQLSGLIDDMDKYELPDERKEFSDSILQYMIDEMKEKNIETYIENVKDKDTFLARSINTKCPGIQDKTEILQFLYARVASLGQLSYKSASKGNDVLRNFVANTEFKHEDNRETKEFLLTVANIEKEAIQSKYTINLENYSKKNPSFKERMGVQHTPVINFSNPQEENYKEEQETDRIA